MSPNRLRPLAGAPHAAVFNTFRRTRHQILYWLPPLLLGYAAMNWAIERYVRVWANYLRLTIIRNEYLNSKPGRQTEAAQEMDSVTS